MYIFRTEGPLGQRHFAHMPESCRTTGNAGRCIRKAKDNALLSVLATLVEVGGAPPFSQGRIYLHTYRCCKYKYAVHGDRATSGDMTGGLTGHEAIPQFKGCAKV